MERRKVNRTVKKLYVRLNVGSITSWGLLGDVSENGLFISSIRDFAIGTAINIEIFMADTTVSLLKGTVRRIIGLPESNRKVGIGVELIGKDKAPKHFPIILDGQTKTPVQTLSTVSNKEVLYVDNL